MICVQRRISFSAARLELSIVAVIGADAGRARVGEQLEREHRSDALALVTVGDRERDLGAVAVADESRDPRRERVAVDVGDDRVAAAVLRGELLELGAAQARLRAEEPRAPGGLAEPLEERGDGGRVAVLERGDAQSRPEEPGLDDVRVHR